MFRRVPEYDPHGLNPTTEAGALADMLKHCPEDFLNLYPVEPTPLNSGRIDTPECAEEADVELSNLLEE